MQQSWKEMNWKFSNGKEKRQRTRFANKDIDLLEDIYDHQMPKIHKRMRRQSRDMNDSDFR